MEEEVVVGDHTHDNTIVDNSRSYYSYKQNRQLKVYEDNETETIRDSKRMGGVDAYSPFHLTQFTTTTSNGGISSGEGNNKDAISILPMQGRVEGILSNDGGMHRAFYQTVSLSLDISNIYNNSNNNDDDVVGQQTIAKEEVNRYEMNIDVTILLPITESIFIDADDPLLTMEYDANNGASVYCKVYIIDSSDRINNNCSDDDEKIIEEQQNKKQSTPPTAEAPLSLSSKCNVQFVHPEVIDIEQPSFASRQYVVAYQISATLDFDFLDMTSSSLSKDKLMEIAIEYGTTLHIRYPAPIVSPLNKGDANVVNDPGDEGLVYIMIQQPVLYHASAATATTSRKSETEESIQYTSILQTDVGNDNAKFNNTPNTPPRPISIQVSTGNDDDYWYITLITMLSALLGGWLVMISLDSVSVWC